MPADDAQSASERLKILMTADAVGGVWQYSIDLVRHLVRGGAEVLLATMGPRPSEEKKSCLAALRGIKLCESDYKLEWMENPWADVDKAGAWLLDLAQDFRPDVIHLNGYAHAALPWRAPVLVVAHSCVYSWWKAVHNCAPPKDPWSEYHRRVSIGLRAADAVVAPSRAMADALSASYAFPAEWVRVIPNFSEAPAYAVVEKQHFFLAAGRAWDKGKNLQMLEQIAERLPWPVHIAGSLARDAVIDEIQRAAVFAHPALYEPFGLAVLEAARAQCCLVLADIQSLTELWDGAAIFVDPQDPEAWVEALTKLAQDDLRRLALGERARLHAAQYSASLTVEQYRSLYQSLLNSRRGEAA